MGAGLYVAFCRRSRAAFSVEYPRIFIVFYALSAIANYGAVIIFAIMIAIAVPLWDRHVPAETNVEDTLWLVGGTLIGCVITALVELAFAQIRRGINLWGPLPTGWRPLKSYFPYSRGPARTRRRKTKSHALPCSERHDCGECAFHGLTELQATDDRSYRIDGETGTHSWRTRTSSEYSGFRR